MQLDHLLTDPVRGLVVKAHIILKHAAPPSGAEADALVQDIQDHVRARLARHEYPRQIVFVSELPKTPAGKVNRKILRDREAEAFETAE